jgi:hypothetical protein
MVKVMKGRYGPYVTDGNVNATLPREMDPMTVTLDQAVALLADSVAKGGGKKPKKKARRKRKPSRSAAKKAEGKKAAKRPRQKAADVKPKPQKRNPSANLRRWMAGDALNRKRPSPERKSLDKARVLEALAKNRSHQARHRAQIGREGVRAHRAQAHLERARRGRRVEARAEAQLCPAGALPEVTVLEITGQDPDGELLARPQHWDKPMRRRRSSCCPDAKRSGPALGRGERVLARLSRNAQRLRSAHHQAAGRQRAQGARRLSRRRAQGASNPSTARRASNSSSTARDRGGALPNELVLAEPLSGRASGSRARAWSSGWAAWMRPAPSA